MSIILNVIWLIFGGVFLALAWFLSGLLMIISIVGIPWARSCFVIAKFVLWPFGKEMVSRKVITGQEDIGTGPLGFLGNIIWFIFCGVWLAIGHLCSALAYFITIIGIPFGFQHLKLVGACMAPIGKTIIEKNDYRLHKVN